MKAVLGLSILALTSAGLISCVSSESGDDADTGSDSSTTDTSSTAAASTTGSTTGSGGATSTSTTDDASTSTTGAGGSCVVMTTPLIADFEDYDGAAAGVDWTWSFNEDGLGFAGFWLHSDEIDEDGNQIDGGEYTLNFIAGADSSTYAISAQDANADTWGGGIGIYTSCLDASAYMGLQFMVKGSTPAGTFDVSVNLDGEQSFASTAQDITADWTQIQVPFNAMTAADTNTVTSTNGVGIVSIVFSAHLVWVQDPDDAENWIPEPGPFELTVDNLSFY